MVATARGVPRAQVALAWLLSNSVITAPIVSATKLQHLDDAIGSVEVKLSEDEVAVLEDPYVPHAAVGFVWRCALFTSCPPVEEAAHRTRRRFASGQRGAPR